MTVRLRTMAAAVVLAAVGLVGCTNNQRTDTPAERAGRDTVYAGDRAAERAGQSANRTDDKAEGAFHELKKDTKESVALLKVKNAFIASDKVDAKNINVDAKEMTIHLYGTAASAQEKKLAEKMAKDSAGPEFKLMSHLKVAAPQKGSK